MKKLNKLKLNNICLFDSKMRHELSLLSTMPSYILESYFPAIYGVWGEHMASALVSENETSIIKCMTISDEYDIVCLDGTLSEIFLQEQEDIYDANMIDAPMLIGNRFDLEEQIELRDIPNNLKDIIDGHRKRIMWIEKELYDELYDDIESSKTVYFDPYRFDADEQNVNSMVYLLHYLPYKSKKSDDMQNVK